MEQNKSEFVAWAFTVKVNKTLQAAPTKTEYIPFFDKLTRLGIEVECKYGEKDKRGHLHYHGILRIKKGFYRPRLHTKGMMVYLKELTDRKGWMKYIQKDQEKKKLEELDEMIEYVHNEHEFSDTPDDYIMPTKKLFK